MKPKKSGHTKCLLGAALYLAASPSAAQTAGTVKWKGHDWTVTTGGMEGVALGSLNNVDVDSSGFLHLKITNTGGNWTSAQLFSTDSLGFGTYQWQVDGPIDRFDKNVVFGLFPYGPESGVGSAGTNEINVEYSMWGRTCGPNADWTDYPASGSTIGELKFTFSLDGGTSSTSRIAWGKNRIQISLISGFQKIGSTAGFIKSWTYAPPDPAANIPQRPMPIGMTLWCYSSPPSDGQNVDLVIRDFEFAPEVSAKTDAGAADGGAARDAGSGGASSLDASTVSGGGTGPLCPGETPSGGSGGMHIGTPPYMPPGTGGAPNPTGGAPSRPDAGTARRAATPSHGCDCRAVNPRASLGIGTLPLVALLIGFRRRRRASRHNPET